MKSRIPRFQSLQEARAFWQTHSVVDYLDDLTPVKLEFATPRKKSVSVKLSGLEVRILQDVLARLTHPRPRAPSHR